MIYVLIFIVLITLHFSLVGQAKLRGQLYYFLLTFLFLFSAFRFEVGCDWSGYLSQFDLQKASPIAAALNQREPLWWLIMGGVIELGLPYPWVNVAASAIFFSGIHVLAKRQPDRFGFLVLLFPILVINMPMSALRQAAAIGVLAIALVAFTDKRLIRFVILTLIASTLHASATIFLLLAPLVKGDYSKSRLALAAILAMPGAYFLSMSAEAQMGVLRYVNTGSDAAGSWARVGLLVVTGVFFFIALQKRWPQAFPHDYKLVSVGALIMLALGPIVLYSTVISDRLGYYLVPIQTIMLARIPYLPLGRSKQIFAAAPYLLLLLVFTVWTIYSWHFQQCYLPYQSWIFGIPGDGTYSY